MSLKTYIIIMLTATLVCWGAFVKVIFNLDPSTAGFFEFILFYFSLFLALVGTFALVGLGVRAWRQRTKLIFRLVVTSFRQAIFFALLLVIVLFLQSQRLLTWWNIILLILGLTILEFFFISSRGRKSELDSE